MGARGQIKTVLRWVLVGRRRGLRSRVRSALGWFTWLDRDATGAEAPPASSASTRAPVAEAPVEEGWAEVLRVDELQPGEVVEVMVGEHAYAVARVSDDEWLACDNVCPHAGGPLGDGVLEGEHVACPWHGYAFDLRDGACQVDDQLSVRVVPVKVDGQRVLLASGRD